MIDHVCENCGIIFRDYISNHRKFCSQSCSKKSMERIYDLVCSFCGSDFQSKRWNKLCCSMICSAKLNNSKIKIRRGNTNYGVKHWNYKGGSLHQATGYIYNSIRGKKILRHRYIMEQYLGRKLKSHEHIHHINRIKTDNRIENLMIMSPSEHSRLHHSKAAI